MYWEDQTESDSRREDNERADQRSLNRFYSRQDADRKAYQLSEKDPRRLQYFRNRINSSEEFENSSSEYSNTNNEYSSDEEVEKVYQQILENRRRVEKKEKKRLRKLEINRKRIWLKKRYLERQKINKYAQIQLEKARAHKLKIEIKILENKLKQKKAELKNAKITDEKGKVGPKKSPSKKCWSSPKKYRAKCARKRRREYYNRTGRL